MRFPAALTLAALLVPGGAEAGEPTPTPIPRGTPFDLAFYFARPGRVFCWSEAGKASWENQTDWVVTEERPYLTQDGFFRAGWNVQGGRPVIRVKLNRIGNAAMDEAVLGNIGRSAVLVWNGRIRNVFELRPRFHPNDIAFSGDFSEAEAGLIADMINYRPTPTPSPRATPSPVPTPRPASLSIF